MEILITVVIVALAAYILFKKFSTSSKCNSGCGSCSSNCSMYKEKSDILKIEKTQKKA
ncbi:MAG: FeoB-associated Cys-rich membrane protein [Clostridium sartagoforme]|nr:FeoB-associated Cys-rich membrane protein [Clostridium sartagoforme]